MLLLGFEHRVLKKFHYRKHFSGWMLPVEFKVHLKKISASEPARLLKCKSFIEYLPEIHCGEHTSPVTGLGLFHVPSRPLHVQS